MVKREGVKMQNTKYEIEKLIKKNMQINIEKIDEDIDLFEWGYIDSFDLLNLIADINEKFNTNIYPDKYERNEINTIRKIINIIMGDIKNYENNTNC